MTGTTSNYTSNPTAAETAELTELLNQDRYARTLANIARRAETLWDDGYTVEMTGASVHFRWFAVTTPASMVYRVCLSDMPDDEIFGDSCTCPAFGKYGDCKHHMAILAKEREQAEAEAFEAMLGSAETGTGCDQYARY